ncbi:MAG: hypothetical protein R3299_10855 [Arenibacter sp.]|nr:hypothetical protein [Arenibacter sp.]
MKKSKEKPSLNSKVGKRWTLASRVEKDTFTTDNFIMGMTNQTTDYNSN